MKPIVYGGFNQIRYLQRDQIDVHAWDNCIYHAKNGLIYPYSYYMDQMADNWDALIFYQYDAVMPLPWRKKAGIYYLYQPFCVAQLGVFGKDVNEELVVAFLKQIPRQFRYWDFPLNQANRFKSPDYPMYDRVNYVLQLQQSYEALSAAYRDNVKRNLKKSHDLGCQISQSISLSAVIELNKQHPGAGREEEYRNFEKLFNQLSEKGLARIYGVNSSSGELMASAVFFFSHKRAYYILVGNHPDGRALGASHALIDAFIRDHAGKELTLDFEGSDVPNLAFFYNGFGAVEEKYPAIKLNRLPFYLKWLKR